MKDGEEGLGQLEPLAERLRQLAQADPERVTLALVRYAHWHLTRLRLGSRGLAGGVTAQDVAQEALRKFLDGERKWNQAVYPTLLDFLKSVVNSLMWNPSLPPMSTGKSGGTGLISRGWTEASARVGTELDEARFMIATRFRDILMPPQTAKRWLRRDRRSR